MIFCGFNLIIFALSTGIVGEFLDINYKIKIKICKCMSEVVNQSQGEQTMGTGNGRCPLLMERKQYS